MSKKTGEIISELKKIYKQEGEINITIFDVVDRMYEMIRMEISRCNLQVYLNDLGYKIWKKKIQMFVDNFRNLKKEEERFEKASIVIQKYIKKYYNRKKVEYTQENTYEIDSGEYGDEEYTEEELDEIEKINKIEYSERDVSYNSFYWTSSTIFM